MPEKSRKPKVFWTAVLFGPALLVTGCATTSAPEVTAEDLRAVQQRVEDVERTNGRLMVRVEETERQLALMQDRVETNRIALQRRGYLRDRSDVYAQAPRPEERPAPAPQSHFPHQSESNYNADPTMQLRMEQRGVSRIPLSQEQSGHVDQVEDVSEIEIHVGDDFQGEGREIVITNETLERYFGSSAPAAASRQVASPTASSSTASSTPRRSGSAHPPVTEERLPTTAELNNRSQPSPASAEEGRGQNRSQRDLLELYQDSLAQYRAGNFGEALKGFTDFLNAGPQANWVDNALYWIGECHYGLGEYQVSVRYFQRIIDELPTADKVPDAMLKMSLAYDRMGQGERALNLLKELVERYPRSNPGRLGKERLENHPLFEGS